MNTIGGRGSGFDPVGKIIEGIFVSDKSSKLIIVADGVKYLFDAEGDCCSYSWISNIEISPRINRNLGYKCNNLKTMDGESFDKDYDYIQVYGYELEFDDGSLFLTYRNSSNGYYGGWLDYKGVYNGNFEGFTKVDKTYTCDFV